MITEAKKALWNAIFPRSRLSPEEQERNFRCFEKIAPANNDDTLLSVYTGTTVEYTYNSDFSDDSDGLEHSDYCIKLNMDTTNSFTQHASISEDSTIENAFPDFSNSIEADRAKFDQETPCRAQKTRFMENMASSSALSPAPLADATQAANTPKRIVKTTPYNSNPTPFNFTNQNNEFDFTSQHSDLQNTSHEQNKRILAPLNYTNNGNELDLISQHSDLQNTFREQNAKKAAKDSLADKENKQPRNNFTDYDPSASRTANGRRRTLPEMNAKITEGPKSSINKARHSDAFIAPATKVVNNNTTNYISNASRTADGQRRILAELHARLDEGSESSFGMARHSATPIAITRHSANENVTISTAGPPPTQSSFLLPEMTGITDLVNVVLKDTTQTRRSASRFSSHSNTHNKSARKTSEVIGRIPMPDEEKEIYRTIEVLQGQVAQLQLELAEVKDRNVFVEAQNQALLSRQSVASRNYNSVTAVSGCGDNGHVKLIEELKNANARIDTYEQISQQEAIQRKIISIERNDALQARDEANNRYDIVCKERDQAVKDHVSALKRCRDVQKEERAAVDDFNKCLEACQRLDDQNNQLKVEIRSFQQQSSATNSSLKSMEAQKNQFETQIQSFQQASSAADDLLERLETKNKQLKTEVRNFQQERSTTNTLIRQLKVQNTQLKVETQSLQQEKLATDTALKSLETDNDRLKAEIRSLQNEQLNTSLLLNKSKGQNSAEIQNLLREKLAINSKRSQGQFEGSEDVTLRPSQDPRLSIDVIIAKFEAFLKNAESTHKEYMEKYFSLDKSVSQRRNQKSKSDCQEAWDTVTGLADMLYLLKDIKITLGD